MQKSKSYVFNILSLIARILAALMLILPAVFPLGFAQAQQPPVSSAAGAIDIRENGRQQSRQFSQSFSDVQLAPYLVENFDYGETAGNLKDVSGGNWVAHQNIGANPIQYSTTSLEMPSYASSGIGGSATFGSQGGEDVNRSFAEQTTGTIYFSALVNISSAASGDYFFHLKDTGIYNLRARIYAKNNSGQLNFGLYPTSTTSTTPPIYSDVSFAYGTTYLVVGKYDVTTLDSALYVLDTCEATEPGTPLLSVSATGDPFPISAIAIRQGGSSSSPAGTVDGIRVANNWSDAVVCTTPTPEMTISKSAPTKIDVGESFDYSLTVGNSLGMAANQVVITDSLPLSVTVESYSAGGVLLDGNVISWTVPSLADGGTSVLTVTVTAPVSETTLVNSDYGVWASNWITRTVGSPVTTTVYDPNLITPISEARAGGLGWYGTIQGNVTALPGTFDVRSFYIQDATGGLYIYPPSGTTIPSMALGDIVKIRGSLSLYHGLLEMSSIGSITWIGPGTVPDPLVTSTKLVGTNQGWLIEVPQGIATWTAPPPAPGSANWSFTYNDGSGAVTVFIDKDTSIDMTGFTSPLPMRIIGLSSAFDGPQITPRHQADIIDLTTPAVTSTVPDDGAMNVSLYYPLKATFNKPMAAETITTTTFILEDPVGLVSGSVGYDAATRSASFTPNHALAPNTHYTATLTTAIKDIYDIALTSPYSWTFSTGGPDVTPPAIANRNPAPGAINISLSTNVVITFTEDIHPSALNQANFSLTGPYEPVPYSMSYDSTSFEVTLNPDTKLLASTPYTVTVAHTIKDWAGNMMSADSTWSFTTMAEGPMNVYFGDLHNHTSYSDGSGTPAQALAAGKAAGFDFMAISDHSYSINDTEWQNTLNAVDSATTANFVALRGFEYTQGAEGHINVYNTVRHAVRTDTTSTCTLCDYTPNLEDGSTVQGFYTWVTISGTVGLDSAGTVMQFNHPGWLNFNDWAYHPEVSGVARLEEVGNGNGSSYTFSEDQYIRSLDYGWKVGATNNADTHTAYWGVNTDDRTGVVMSELTRDALLEALRERRTFATEDKNFSLTMKANGQWMGSEITNTGQVVFAISGTDPDGELAALVQIITNQGKVAAQYTPATASFTWTPELVITPGVHYFYVKVTQTDGDRIVSSPVWTQGSENIGITDLSVEPTIPTIYNPSLITVRVTNRNTADRPISVSLDVDGTPVGSAVDLTVPGNGDNFANFSWQPTVTGEVTVTAHISGVPAGDNPDDNQATLHLTVTDEHVPLILIDAGKNNLNATGNEMEMFIDDLSAHKYNVLKNLDVLTAADLNPSVVKLLFITAPASSYSADELTAIGNYVNAGGNLWLSGMSDYSSGTLVADRENAILAAIETQTGGTINMRFNDDEVLDGNDNNGYPWGVYWSSFPMTQTTGIGINIASLTSWSVASLVNRSHGPLTAATPGVQIVVQGDLDTGSTDGEANHTSNTDADNGGDAYIYNSGWVSPWDVVPVGAVPVPMAAVTDMAGTPGRILLYGDSNDAFNKYAYVAGDGKQNELFNLEAIMWLMGEPLHKSTIAEARAQLAANQPTNLDKLVWIEGTITAAYGEFFNMLYVQDETGGVAVHAPAGDIDAAAYTRGTKVRVVGTVGIYNGDTEIEFFEPEMVQVIQADAGVPSPLTLSTHEASLEENQGWLSIITGTVTSKLGEDTLFVDDGSGPVRVFLDGYNGDFSDVQIHEVVQVIGLVSEDGDGPRIRVRNHLMHPEYPDDVHVLLHIMYIPLALRH